jgi:hypothetical protein
MKTLCFNPPKKISRISIDREDHNIYKGSNLNTLVATLSSIVIREPLCNM